MPSGSGEQGGGGFRVVNKQDLGSSLCAPCCHSRTPAQLLLPDVPNGPPVSRALVFAGIQLVLGQLPSLHCKPAGRICHHACRLLLGVSAAHACSGAWELCGPDQPCASPICCQILRASPQLGQ